MSPEAIERKAAGKAARGKAPAPTVLAGRFELTVALGTGGMATVYRAWDRAAGRICAVKVLGDVLSRDEEFRQRFRREAEAARTLAHPSIVSVYDCGEDEVHQFIVMEYVGGGTVRDLLRRRGRVSEAEAVRLAAGVADALAYAHSRGVVHRDVKPHNILLTEEGRVKVADFGIARTLDGTSLTRTGTIMGSAPYISPEQARGEQAGPAADLYALGIVLYEMLAGRVPFAGEAPVAVALKHLHEAPPHLVDARPDLSPQTAALVERLLAKAPEDRYPTAAALAADLHALEAALPAAPDDTTVLPRSAAGGDATTRLERPPADASAPTVRFGGEPGTATGRLSPAGASPPPPNTGSGRAAVLPGVPAAGIGAAAGTTGDTTEFPGPVRARRGISGLHLGAGAIVVAVALALIGLGYRTAWIAAHVTVPALAGRTVADAGKAVQPLQLGVIVASQRQDPRASVGVVIAQNPPPGRQVVRGTVIELTVSQGSGVVPDLRGQSASQAIHSLEAAGLRLGQVGYTPYDAAPAGVVIYQFQPPGTRLAANGAVDVLVSQGAPAFGPRPSEAERGDKTEKGKH